MNVRDLGLYLNNAKYNTFKINDVVHKNGLLFKGQKASIVFSSSQTNTLS